MSAPALLKRFDIVADHSANIPALRRLVVDLAVRGKLLPTNELDMDVPEMLGRISAKVNRLTLAGLIKKQKSLSEIGNDEVPAAYLAHCTFARLGNIANLQKGLTGIQSSMPGEFPLVVTAAERGTCDHFDFDSAAAIIPLVSSTGHGNASINRLHYQEGKFALGTILCAVIPFDEELISARFLFEYLTAFKEELLVSKMIGTANVTLTLGKIAEVPVPVLAPAVQRRVDELMALCDQLEAAQQERERRRDRLAAASLQRLNLPVGATTPEVHREHARFHLHHLPRLTTRPEHITAMRQTILELAVCGRLVHQDLNEETAFELLKRIDLENQVLKKAKGISTQKAGVLTEGTEAEADIPATWVRANLQDISYQITDGTHLTPKYTEQGKPFLSAQNVKPFRFIPQKHRFVSLADFGKYRSNRKPERGDVLLTRVGAGIGEAAVLDSDLEFAFYVSLCLIKVPTKYLLPEYLVLWLNSPEGRKCSMARTYGKGASQGNLNLGQIRTFKVPLPPLAEQHRIAAKVDELMALCDQLEAQLTTTQTDSRRLLEAVLEAALAPA